MEMAPTEFDWDDSVPFDRHSLAWVMQSVSSTPIRKNCLSLTMTMVPRLGTTGWGSRVLWRKLSLMSCVTALRSAITIVQAGLAQREGMGEKVCVRCRACCPCCCLQEPASLDALFFTQKPQACTSVSHFPSISPQFSPLSSGGTGDLAVTTIGKRRSLAWHHPPLPHHFGDLLHLSMSCLLSSK